jgi:hypothetical protein
MSHQDGRCAADSEVIYVENKAGCVTDALAAGSGTLATPFCGPQAAVDALTDARRVLIISGSVSGVAWTALTGARPVTLIGRATAAIAPGTSNGISVVGPGELYARDMVVRNSEQVGVLAENGATLRLHHVTVDSNRGGGILVDSSSFEIDDTTVSGNGPGQLPGGVVWGGIRIQMPSSVATLNLVTVMNNQSVGVSCSTGVVGTGVLATGNAGGVDVTAACAISACSPAGSTCGAQ